ncbi:MAG TPA: hypothetical protein VEO01_09690 [Pseudonocardiaceae bacterium]|nr:hypothetical protein [Pseudonocardiaceae bacterium]
MAPIVPTLVATSLHTLLEHIGEPRPDPESPAPNLHGWRFRKLDSLHARWTLSTPTARGNAPVKPLRTTTAGAAPLTTSYRSLPALHLPWISSSRTGILSTEDTDKLPDQNSESL